MKNLTIAIISPGEMGSAVGQALRSNDYRIVTYLKGRSERTRALARNAGFEICQTLTDLVSEADLILSILVPSEAVTAAAEVSKAIVESNSDVYFADCNAVAPETVKQIESNIVSAGGKFIDGSIIGLPPGKEVPRFYTAGEHAHIMDQFDGKGLSIKRISNETGKASALKMCYAGLTKGKSALMVAMLSAAQIQGVSDELTAELEFSQKQAYTQIKSQMPTLPSKAYRWAGEMDEIVKSLKDAGVTSHFHLGAANIYRKLSRTPSAIRPAKESDISPCLRKAIQDFIETEDS